LDNAIISDQFKEIEKKVAKLIAVCKEHEATNLELKNKINSLEEELLGKIEGNYRSLEHHDRRGIGS
jgi:hypothetical protein